ncbi:MAG: CARDB domain-containing protein [Candidatus Geothermincolia bacterium]
MAQFSNSRPRYSSGRKRKNLRSRRGASVGPTPARRRGPAPILIIAGIIVLLVFCWIFGRGCGGNQEAKENEKLREYTGSANKLIGRSSTVGAQFDTLRNGIKGMARQDVESKLQQMVNSCKEIAKDAMALKVPSKAATLQPLLQLSFDLRASGVDQYKVAILDVIDKKNIDTATQTMSGGLLDLVVSDRSMQRFKGGLQEKLSQAKLGFEKVADSAYLPKVDQALTAGVSEYISGISGTETGNALHGVAVIGLTTAPAKVDSTESGVAILPYQATFTVKVAVQNQGNQQEDNVPVVVTLDQDPQATQQKKTQKITRLKAGETATLVFEDIKPGTGADIVNSLKVTAGPVAGEQKVDNNTMEMQFIMRSDSTQTP